MRSLQPWGRPIAVPTPVSLSPSGYFSCSLSLLVLGRSVRNLAQCGDCVLYGYVFCIVMEYPLPVGDGMVKSVSNPDKGPHLRDRREIQSDLRILAQVKLRPLAAGVINPEYLQISSETLGRNLPKGQ